jgi:CRISPR-associated protein Cmr4
MTGRSAQVASEKVCVYQKRLYLEDIDLPAESSADVKTWAQRLAALAALEDDLFTHRFVVVDDDTMTFFWETATQVDARVRLDDATRTVAQGALWLEESLPPETLLIGLLAADRSRRPEMEMTPDAVLDFALPKEAILQFGGKATIGRGRCRIIPV